MSRAIAAVLVGYVVLFALVFATFSTAYLLMGPDRAFRPGSYEISGLWAAVSFALGFIAAVAGGFVCAAVARRSGPPKVLAGLVLVLGLIMAIPVVLAEKPASQPVRTAEVGNMEAMRNAQEPVGTAVLNPLVGSLGILLGARIRRGRPAVHAAQT